MDITIQKSILRIRVYVCHMCIPKLYLIYTLLATTDMEKTEVLNLPPPPPVFTGKCSSHITPVTEGKGRDWKN